MAAPTRGVGSGAGAAPNRTIVVAVVVNLTGLYRYIPEIVNASISLLADASIPVAMLLVGASMFGEFQKDSKLLHGQLKLASYSILWRMMLLPLLMFTMTC